ncbi:MAG TPA: carcinine hydrolase/isopenicillin-N N-acyltransferase family protein [Planctomycetota bacterium]|jgi:hypothetical protein
MGDELIILQGAPAARGGLLGLSQKEPIRKRVADFKALCDKSRLGPMELPDRARQLTTTLNVLGQEWLTEARALAGAAQVPTATFLAITSPPETVQPALLPKRANDSTSVATSVNGAAIGAMFMENCDGPDIVHHVISRAASPGTLAYIGLCELGDLGVKAFVNEAGLAGSFHIGPPVEDHTATPLTPTLVLRQICERATSCEQAMAEFEALQKRMGPTTPDKRGVCYLFADSTGEVMLLEASATRFMYHHAPEGFIITTNKFQLSKTLQTTVEPFRQRCIREYLSNGTPTLRRLVEVSRIDRKAGGEKGVCDNDTRASMLCVLGAGGHPSYALVTIGTPLLNLPVPLFPGVGAARELVDDSAFTAAMRAADAAGARVTRRAEYEQVLFERLSALNASTSKEQLGQLCQEMSKLAQQFAMMPAEKG